MSRRALADAAWLVGILALTPLTLAWRRATRCPYCHDDDRQGHHR